MVNLMAGRVVLVPSASPLLSSSLWGSRLLGHGAVCLGSYPTTLTPRTYSLVTMTSNTAHEITHGSVGTGDVVRAWSA